MGAVPWPDTIAADTTPAGQPAPACRDCGHTGRGLVPSLVPGEHYCASRRACEKRQQAALRGTDYGAWGTSPKWSRKRSVQHPATDGEPA